MSLSARLSLLFLVVRIGLPVIDVAAQPQGAPTPQQMFDQAQAYASNKQAELEKQGTKIDANLSVKIRQEQRELAGKLVESLLARGTPVGDDLYYVGRLQQLAGNESAALDSLRLFLALNPDGELAQQARPAAISCALRKKFIEEAEQIDADYQARAAQNWDQRFEIETQFAYAYRSATDFDNMARHAKTMYKMAKQALTDKACKMPRCEELLVNSVALVAEAYLKENRPDDSLAVFERLEKFAMARPSAVLFMMAAGRFKQFNPSIDPFRVVNDVVETQQQLPELKISDWIDMQPAKFADLRGRVVLLDFWATWCGPCRMTFPDLRRLNASFKDKGLTIIGVTKYFGNVDGRKVTKEQELAYLRDFKKKNELAYGFAVEDSDAGVIDFGVYGIPTYVLIDRRGNVRLMGTGSNGSSDTTLDKAIKRLIDEPVTESKPSSDQVQNSENKKP